MARFEDGSPLLDADACAREPIHIIGHIQSHGLLLALSEPDLIVRQVSANASALLGLSPQAALGQSLQTVLGAPQFETFQTQLLTGDLLASDPLRFVVGESAVEMDCVAHRQDDVLIVELERRLGAYSLEPLNIAAHVRIPLSHMEQAVDILELSQLAADEVRKLSRFDRVMIYRFDEQWNGDVIAESVGASSVSYRGLRFPASDIPAQARRLFLTNRLRAIADVASTPVPIVPEIGPLTGRALDLTRSSLRSAAPIHLEYLRNMGVQSSMTVSIIVKGALWGMIACHDPAPHRVDWSTRSVCELVGQVLASQVTLRADNAALQSRLMSRRRLENYRGTADTRRSGVDAAAFPSARLFELLDGDGLISRIDGVVSYQGTAVEVELLLPVIGKLQRLSLQGIASSNMLGALDRSAEQYAAKASGALFLGLTEGSEAGDFVMFLRRELVETVIWAGNPDKAVSADKKGRLSPRNSFAAWQQTVRGRSRRWTDVELEGASFLRENLLRLREAQRLGKSEERVRYLAEHDSLTGLINRHSMDAKLEQCVKDGELEGSSFAVLFIDLDHFKHFNDTYGHAVGDQILKIVAQRMEQQLRAEAVVGRWGGDEFIVVMPGARLSALLAAATRILRAIEKPLGIDHESDLNITASVGLSRYPVDGTTTEQLLSSSDRAMYIVKGKGGNASGTLRANDAGEGGARAPRHVAARRKKR